MDHAPEAAAGRGAALLLAGKHVYPQLLNPRQIHLLTLHMPLRSTCTVCRSNRCKCVDMQADKGRVSALAMSSTSTEADRHMSMHSAAR